MELKKGINMDTDLKDEELILDTMDIQDLSKLKITKIKPWAIYFTYNNEKYLLKGRSSDYEYDIQLYHRIPINNKGQFQLEWIAGRMWTTDNIANYFIKDYGRKHTVIYSHINKEYFVKKLVRKEFCTSLFDNELKDKIKRINDYKKEIKNLEDKIQNIRNKIRDEEKF